MKGSSRFYLGQLLHDAKAATVLVQLGVVFLLFSIGLELSIDRLVKLRR